MHFVLSSLELGDEKKNSVIKDELCARVLSIVASNNMAYYIGNVLWSRIDMKTFHLFLDASERRCLSFINNIFPRLKQECPVFLRALLPEDLQSPMCPTSLNQALLLLRRSAHPLHRDSAFLQVHLRGCPSVPEGCHLLFLLDGLNIEVGSIALDSKYA